MPGPTEAEFNVVLAELKSEIALAAQRVIDKIAALIASHPDLTDELQSVSDDIATIKTIAPVEMP